MTHWIDITSTIKPPSGAYVLGRIVSKGQPSYSYYYIMVYSGDRKFMFRDFIFEAFSPEEMFKYKNYELTHWAYIDEPENINNKGE